MGRLLKYSSARFVPRINDYTCSQRRAIRPRVGERAVRELPRNEVRSGFSPKECVDARR